MTRSPSTTATRPLRERGSSTVELLIVAVALLAFTGGLIGVGRLTGTRAALAGVAREAARTAADATTPTQAIRTGQQRGQLVAAGYQLNPNRLQITVNPAGLVRGGTLTVTASYQVPLDDLPTLGLLPGQLTLTAHQREPIDPHRSR
jgi:Flp pilus assembly protein TadG